MKNAREISDGLNRTVKMAIDSGEADSLEAAQQLFEGYRLRVCVGRDVAASATQQVSLLTIVNAARRCFLGGVFVDGCPDADLLVPWKDHTRLRDAVTALEGHHAETIRSTDACPVIVVGDADCSGLVGPCVIRATFDGWVGGVTSLADDHRLAERGGFPPSGVLAGALATSEVFQHVRGSNPLAGQRDIAISLWRPDASPDCLAAEDMGPDLEILPAKVWLLGLGHLGQAFLWTLGFLPYGDPSQVLLHLQDTDEIVSANDSTSPLTNASLISSKKTRAMAAWCEQRGFNTRIVERLFAGDFKVKADEPRLAVCGVDNAVARKALEDVGFDQVVEAGLGTGGEEYLAYQIHTFPGKKTAGTIWPDPIANTTGPFIQGVPAYKRLELEGIDECGLTQLGNRSVGACFVGLFASSLMIAEVIRSLIGGPTYDVIDGSLRNPTGIAAVKKLEGPSVNVGYTPAQAPNLGVRS